MAWAMRTYNCGRCGPGRSHPSPGAFTRRLPVPRVDAAVARLMALDLGEKRIGVAVTDVEQTMAFPERVLQRRSAKADRQTVSALVRELAVERLVIGLPLSMEGEHGPNAERAERFGEYLGRVLPIPIDFQ